MDLVSQLEREAPRSETTPALLYGYNEDVHVDGDRFHPHVTLASIDGARVSGDDLPGPSTFAATLSGLSVFEMGPYGTCIRRNGTRQLHGLSPGTRRLTVRMPRRFGRHEPWRRDRPLPPHTVLRVVVFHGTGNYLSMSENAWTPEPQEQAYPGATSEMSPQPRDEMRDYQGRNLLHDQRALITGGDSGIGRAVAIAFAKEGADVAIAYLSEHDDARHTQRLIENEGRRCVLLPGDLANPEHCAEIVERSVAELGGLELLVNNAAYQAPQKSLTDISHAQWERTFDVNMNSFFWVTKAALHYLPEGSAIINTASVNGLRGNKDLIDYSATKGAILAFSYSLAQSLTEQRIRVNCVAPGPVWTPLIPATFPSEKVGEFGQRAPMKQPAQPDEIAPSYVFFASNTLSSYYTGEVLAPTGGETLPG